MLEIKEYAKKMKEELCGAKEYAECYQKHKTENPTLAKKYMEMANDEIKHANFFHELAVDKIKKLQADKVEVPEYMIILWNEKHKKYIDKLAKIKTMLSM